MITNLGNLDRVLRIVIGLVLAASALMLPGAALKVVLLLAAAIALLTGSLSFCPLYKVLGISTCSRP